MTPAGIEPATFGFVAQRLNHCATAVPANDTVPKVNPTHFDTTVLTISRSRMHTGDTSAAANNNNNNAPCIIHLIELY